MKTKAALSRSSSHYQDLLKENERLKMAIKHLRDKDELLARAKNVEGDDSQEPALLLRRTEEKLSECHGGVKGLADLFFSFYLYLQGVISPMYGPI